MADETGKQMGSVLDLVERQRSHLLFVLSDAKESQRDAFRKWYVGPYREATSKNERTLSIRLYEQHEIDITKGRFPRAPLHFLSLYELSLDGAERAQESIEQVTCLHEAERSAGLVATWLYYPVSEKVGRSPPDTDCMLTVALANAVPGQEAEFVEWYATRHIRHALHITALVSGQCFQRTLFQAPGALEPAYNTLALYEQTGSAEDFLEGHAALPPGTLNFPALDRNRFAESLYHPI